MRGFSICVLPKAKLRLCDSRSERVMVTFLAKSIRVLSSSGMFISLRSKERLTLRYFGKPRNPLESTPPTLLPFRAYGATRLLRIGTCGRPSPSPLDPG